MVLEALSQNFSTSLDAKVNSIPNPNPTPDRYFKLPRGELLRQRWS